MYISLLFQDHQKTKSSCQAQRTLNISTNVLIILLITCLITVLLVPAFYYLFYCVGTLNIERQELDAFKSIKEKEHYEPSRNSRDTLDVNFNSSNPNIIKLAPPPKPDYDQCKLLNDNEKFDCYPESGANASGCEARGCCWLAPKIKGLKNVEMDTPYCFYPPNYSSYDYVNITETPFGLVSFLRRKFKSAYPADVETIKMTVRYETESRLHIKVFKKN